MKKTLNIIFLIGLSLVIVYIVALFIRNILGIIALMQIIEKLGF